MSSPNYEKKDWTIQLIYGIFALWYSFLHLFICFMMKIFYSFVCFILCCNGLLAQKYLQIEKYGSAKTEKLAIGTTITFRLKGEKKQWRTEKITELYPNDSLILTEQRLVKLDKIVAFQKQRALPRILGNKLMQFGAAWLVYGGIGHLAGYRYQKGDFILSGSAIVGGYLLKKSLSQYQIHFGTRHRLRIVDLSFGKPKK